MKAISISSCQHCEPEKWEVIAETTTPYKCSNCETTITQILRVRKEIQKLTLPSDMDEFCANCGLTYGAHHGGTSPWPYNYCPGHESRMDWENGPGTTFKGTGMYKDREPGRPANTKKRGDS